jgi:serine/threonine protein kinase
MNPASDQNFLFVLIAYQNAYITVDQFLECAVIWNKDPKREIGEILVEKKFLDETERFNIHGIVEDRIRRLGGLENSLSFALDNGSVPDVQDLPEQWADRLTRETKIIPPRDSSSNEPIASRYQLRHELGGGGQGIVYEADDLELGRRVAIKKVRRELEDDPNAIGSLIEEARNTSRLDHSSIVPVFDINKDERGKPLFAMRLIRGEKLSDVIDRIDYKHLTPSKYINTIRPLLRHLIDVCNAVQYAFDDNDVIHRDIKPDNIMIDRYGDTVLMDWGMGKSVNDSSQLDEQASIFFRPSLFDSDSGSERTRAGTIKGTMHYISPEQAHGLVKQVDHRTDIYLLGATLYKLLVGKTPYRMDQGKFFEMLQRARKNEFQAPRVANPLVPKELEAICLKAMATEPNDRYQRADALAQDLENWIAGEPVTALPDGLLRKTERWLKRHARSAIIGLTILSLGVAGLTWANLAIRDQERKTLQSRAFASEVLDKFADEYDSSLAQFPDTEERRLVFLTRTVADVEKHAQKNPDDYNFRIDLVRLLTRLARVEGKSNTEQALKHFDQATEIIKASVTAPIPSKDRINWDIAEGDMSYFHADLLIQNNKLEEAYAVNNVARIIGERLNRQEPGNPSFAVSHQRSLLQLGQIFEKDGKTQEAAQAFREGNASLKPFVDQYRETPVSDSGYLQADNGEDGAVFYYMLGRVLEARVASKQNDQTTAEAIWTDALGSARLALKFENGQIDGSNFELICLNELHQMMLQSDRFDEATKYYEESMQASQQKQNPEQWLETWIKIATRHAMALAEPRLVQAIDTVENAESILADKKFADILEENPSLKLQLELCIATSKVAIAKQKLALNQATAEEVQAAQNELQGLVDRAKTSDGFDELLKELERDMKPIR